MSSQQPCRARQPSSWREFIALVRGVALARARTDRAQQSAKINRISQPSAVSSYARGFGLLTAVRVDSWDDHANGSPSGSRPDAELTAQLPYPRHHPLDANPQGKEILIAACRHHASAVILDRYVEQIVFPCKIDTHGRCRGVPMHIGQGFLNNTKRSSLK